MERFFELGRLLDFYGALLTERQQSLLRQYADEDCSLGEIAEREGISRQAVRDAIVHGNRQLAAYEDALGLAKRLERARQAADTLRASIAETAPDEAARRRLTEETDALIAIWEE